MSEVALFKGAALPAFVKKGALSALAKSLIGGSGKIGKSLSIKGGVFRLMQDGKEVAQIDERSIPIVIVNAAPKVGRVLYLKKYDADAAAAPDCWSGDGNVPDDNVPTPQHDNCAECPQNVKGSGEGESKKCRYQQHLAVVPVFDDILGDEAMELTLPALSLFGKESNGRYPLQAYARFLAAQGETSPDMLVTQMRFDTSVEHPKVFFKPMRWLTEDEYAQAQELAQSPEALRAITPTMDAAPAAAPNTIPGKRPTKAVAEDDDAEDDEAPAPAPAPKKRKPKPAPAPVVEDDDDDEDEDEATAPAPAPKVRKAAAPATAPAPNSKPSLADLAASWDDEDDDEDD